MSLYKQAKQSVKGLTGIQEIAGSILNLATYLS